MITQVINLAATVVAFPVNNIPEQPKITNTNPVDIYVQDDFWTDAAIGTGVGAMSTAVGAAIGGPVGAAIGVAIGAITGAALNNDSGTKLPPAENPNHHYAMGSGTSISSSSSSSNQHCTGAYNTYNCY